MRYSILMILIPLLVAGCISEIEFLDEENSFISISGIITDNYQKNIITIVRVNGYTGEVEKLKATGAYYKDGAMAGPLAQFNSGELVFPIDFRVEEGASYSVEIKVDNKVYRSHPQLIGPKLKMDSVSFEVNTRLDGTSSTGTLANTIYADFFAHITVPSDHREKSQFYRWQVDEIWEHREVKNNGDPEDTVNICYPRTDVTEYPSVIVSTETLEPGSAKVFINSREIGRTFLHKHFFNAYLHTINEPLYRFYDKSQQLIDDNGSLYDVTPAAIDGNLFNADDESDRVLGVIEFAQVDTLRLGIYGYETKVSTITDYCQADDPCREFVFQGGFPPPPCPCYDCDKVFGAQTLIKPDYWDE
ncbi:MAG: hypothetical protein KDD63_15745 [Bacteroidetes bacterium]|nr:hypothetical protein [Bacteroidota bacterium]